MRIGIVTEYYYPTLGGIQEHVHHFARHARAAGHDVRILTPEVKDQLASVSGVAPAASVARRNDEENGVIRVGVSIPLFSGGSIARLSGGRGLSARVRDLVRGEKLDVVHVHSPLMPTLPLLALRASEALNVGTFHSAFDRSLLYALLKGRLQPYMDRLDAAVGVSETALAGVRRYFRAPFQVIPNGVEVAAFAEGRRRPEFADGRANLLHVGRFDPRNGVDRVIRAWVRVRRMGTDARLILVGDGPLRPRYEAMVPADLRADAHFVGFVPSGERASYYASGDVLLCPAVGGTFGIIVLEAMAAGCAVVAADTPGFRHVVQDGVDGVLVDVAADPGSQELARQANRLLSDQAARRRTAEAGRRRAARFDWAHVAGEVLELYGRLRGDSVLAPSLPLAPPLSLPGARGA
ncbi:MAG TPA: glycosyltransferase family 4 protein [Polyangia bacterium]|nr:glycosyltransferase family 4 protein [Polyangia bacterium]